MGYHIVFIIGFTSCIYLLLILIYALYPYLRHSDLKKYINDDSFAMVTGSTDGIGKAVALELAKRGANIILHGRNEDKLHSVALEIKEQFPACRVVCINHDGNAVSDIDTAMVSHLNISILVNSVGVGPISPLAEFTDDKVFKTIRLNAMFPSQLTRKLLPQLNRQPSVILNVSSYAAIYPPPYLAVYAGTKAYNNAFSISLSRELENIEVISLITGSVNTGSNTKQITFMRPSAAVYAKYMLLVVGCGRKSIMPYWPHAIQQFLISLFPEKIVDFLTKKALKKELKPSA